MKYITVLDSIMGSGKTSWAIQEMQQAPIDQKFIYVTPSLDEVQRIINAVPNRDFKEPNVQHGKGTKFNSLKILIRNGENIATTHKLFGFADDELIGLLEKNSYTLILDEVMDVVTSLNSKKDDISLLKKSESIKIKDDGQVIWMTDATFDTLYNEIRDYAIAGNLYNIDNSIFIWNFPPRIFSKFKKVFLLTYLFQGQKLKYYCDLHGINYQCYSVIKSDAKYKLIDKNDNKEDRTSFVDLINIYDGKYNNVGDSYYALSKSWFEKPSSKTKIESLKNNLYCFLRNRQVDCAKLRLWTTFKGCKAKLRGKGFSKEEPQNNNSAVGAACFIPFNMRSTNKYKHKTSLAFCLNRFMHPIEKRFFSENGVIVNEELFALSDMLQWIFRSAIREGNPIDIYIPSRRMRQLLIKWLNNEI